MHFHFALDGKQVMGIMNGTTNFMLTKMEQEGADYAVVLKEAQDLGFAEADPTADVEGHDVQAKIALLAKVLYTICTYCCIACCHLCTSLRFQCARPVSLMHASLECV
jgi:homoserine dehydrogenase